MRAYVRTRTYIHACMTCPAHHVILHAHQLSFLAFLAAGSGPKKEHNGEYEKERRGRRRGGKEGAEREKKERERD